jgi:hypothetical protein
VELCHHSPICIHGIVINLIKYRDNFTFIHNLSSSLRFREKCKTKEKIKSALLPQFAICVLQSTYEKKLKLKKKS